MKQRVDVKRTTGTRLFHTAAKRLYNTNFLAMKLNYLHISNPGNLVVCLLVLALAEKIPCSF